MKLRQLANKLLLGLVLAIVIGTQSVGVVAPLPLATAATKETTETAKTYYFDQYQVNSPTATAGESLYDALGIKVYNDYLSAVAATQGLRDVVIAVVDTGLDYQQPVFNGRILGDYAMDFSYGLNLLQISNLWYQDENGHGTHVAGIIADLTPANVKILPIRIFNGFTNSGDDYAFQNAVRYLCALKAGRKVNLYNSSGVLSSSYVNTSEKQLNIVAVNLSLGTSGYNVDQASDMQDYREDKYGYQKDSTYYTGYQTTIDLLLHYGMQPIVAAGNVDADKEDASTTYYSLPGSCDGVISVAAYDNTDQADGAYLTANFSYHNDCIGLASPGVKIWSACSQYMMETLRGYRASTATDANGEYAIFHNGDAQWPVRPVARNVWYYRSDGTSMATPFVTACYALLMCDSTKNTPEDFGITWDSAVDSAQYFSYAHKALVLAAANYNDQGAAGYDEYFGYGVLNMECFATEDVLPMTETVTGAPAHPNTTYPNVTLDNVVTANYDNENNWFVAVCVLILGGGAIWAIGLFRSYLTRRRTTAA